MMIVNNCNYMCNMRDW